MIALSAMTVVFLGLFRFFVDPAKSYPHPWGIMLASIFFGATLVCALLLALNLLFF